MTNGNGTETARIYALIGEVERDLRIAARALRAANRANNACVRAIDNLNARVRALEERDAWVDRYREGMANDARDILDDPAALDE